MPQKLINVPIFLSSPQPKIKLPIALTTKIAITKPQSIKDKLKEFDPGLEWLVQPKQGTPFKLVCLCDTTNSYHTLNTTNFFFSPTQNKLYYIGDDLHASNQDHEEHSMCLSGVWQEAIPLDPNNHFVIQETKYESIDASFISNNVPFDMREELVWE